MVAYLSRQGQLCLQGKPTNPHLHAGAYMSAYQKWPIGLRCLHECLSEQKGLLPAPKLLIILAYLSVCLVVSRCQQFLFAYYNGSGFFSHHSFPIIHGVL